MTSHSDLSCCNSTLVERSLAIKLCIVDFSSCSPCLLVCNSTRNLLLSFSSWLTLPSARRLKQDMEWVNAIDGCGSIQFLFCRHMLLPANSRENLEGTVVFLERAVLQFLLLQLSAILTQTKLMITFYCIVSFALLACSCKKEALPAGSTVKTGIGCLWSAQPSIKFHLCCSINEKPLQKKKVKHPT